jgi:L-threonylcarbamoyladenylate synthase
MMRAERVPLERLLIPDGRKKLEDLAESIKQGAVFIYPTETIYGIGGMFGVQGIEERIFQVKQRPAEIPFILIAADRSTFDPLHLSWPPAAIRLAAEFWPGLLTLVLPGKTGIDTAIRVSPHPLVIALYNCLRSPVYSTSANVSGKPYVNDSDIIYERFKDEVDFMVDAGQLAESLPSTIVRVSLNNTVSILRHGAIDTRQIIKAQ